MKRQANGWTWWTLILIVAGSLSLFTEIAEAGQYTSASTMPLKEYVDGSLVELAPAASPYPNLPHQVFGTPFLMKEGDKYILWLHTEHSNEPGGARAYGITQRFESSDGLTWHNRTDTNLVMHDTSWHRLGGISQVIKQGETYEAWDQYYWERSVGWGWNIRYLKSTDGLNWTVVNQPALLSFAHANVIKQGDQYKMWATRIVDGRFDPNVNMAITHRVSDQGGSNWGAWYDGGESVTIDGQALQLGAAPIQVRQLPNGTYQLFYVKHHFTPSINVATSQDGIHFTTQTTGLVDLATLVDYNGKGFGFMVVDMNGEDWFYFTYQDQNNQPHIVVSRPTKPAAITKEQKKTDTAWGTDPLTVALGEIFSYRISVENFFENVVSVVITDAVSAYVEYVADSLKVYKDGMAVSVHDEDYLSYDDKADAWLLDYTGDLFESIILTFDVTVKDIPAGSVINNMAMVSSSDGEASSNKVSATVAEDAAVPEPGTVLLLGIGLFGCVAFTRKRAKK